MPSGLPLNRPWTRSTIRRKNAGLSSGCSSAPCCFQAPLQAIGTFSGRLSPEIQQTTRLSMLSLIRPIMDRKPIPYPAILPNPKLRRKKLKTTTKRAANGLMLPVTHSKKYRLQVQVFNLSGTVRPQRRSPHQPPHQKTAQSGSNNGVKTGHPATATVLPLQDDSRSTVSNNNHSGNPKALSVDPDQNQETRLLPLLSLNQTRMSTPAGIHPASL